MTVRTLTAPKPSSVIDGQLHLEQPTAEPEVTQPVSREARPHGKPSVESTDAALEQVSEDDVYLPRKLLDRVPVALSPVMLVYPDAAPGGRYTLKITVFIDETGQVRRIRMEHGEVPAALREIATQAFMSARFAPGERQHQPVKARLTMEVEFAADTDHTI